jgi:hypothetical protein
LLDFFLGIFVGGHSDSEPRVSPAAIHIQPLSGLFFSCQAFLILNEPFTIALKPPQYEKGVDTQIICEYQQNKKFYDIIAGGSGFHQTLMLAFLYGYQPTTILLDEPDAHLHVNLQ